MPFDWQAFEAVAAVAGAIGVVVSIIFLMYEVCTTPGRLRARRSSRL